MDDNPDVDERDLRGCMLILLACALFQAGLIACCIVGWLT